MPIKKLLLLIHMYSQQLPCTTGPFAHRCNSYSSPPKSFLSPSQNRPVESQLCVYADLHFCTHLLPSFPVFSQVDDLRTGPNFSFPDWVGLPTAVGLTPPLHSGLLSIVLVLTHAGSPPPGHPKSL